MRGEAKIALMDLRPTPSKYVTTVISSLYLQVGENYESMRSILIRQNKNEICPLDSF